MTETLLKNKLEPFVSKKVVEYLGEAMQDVVDHVVSAVGRHMTAEQVHKELEQALGEDAEIFVMKLWRILVYETEARSQGIL